jgi:radical SAM superfamily enzyme YgiQ (UPF0313 family)
MRVLLADLPARDGFVSKDTVVGGYGSRLLPFSRVTRVIGELKRRVLDVPSVQLAHMAAVLGRYGHEVIWSHGEIVQADVAIVLSSLVDHRHEVAWAGRLRRATGARVGFVGLAASKLPHLFRGAADFIVIGEAEAAIERLARDELLTGDCASEPAPDLDALPFARWDAFEEYRRRVRVWPFSRRPYEGRIPLLASRGCPEFCTYCPHRILAGHRVRSVSNIADELKTLCDRFGRPYVIFRDPLFTADRERALALADEILARDLDLRFACETRLDRLDPELLDALHRAGLRSMTFGVESVSPDILRRVGRRPTPEPHQRLIIEHCRRRRIVTAAFYVLGFLQDDWSSIAATIEYATALGSTLAQFKLLTPYPATPLWKQLAPRVYETDWEKFDGFSPTFEHPSLTPQELRFLLGAAYTRFYIRPSFASNWTRVTPRPMRSIVRWADGRIAERHAREELAMMSRAVTC